MNRLEGRLKKELYLDKFVFTGLTNLNTGFDVPSIKYFSALDFEIVLKRVRQLGLGIYGIEPWKNGEYYWAVTYEEVTNDPTDPSWYIKAFEDFKKDEEELQYAATYYIPDGILTEE
ncbi:MULTISPECIES: hypothetical protein [Hymenobacter]|uniref:Uncharacterized protein n=1 Tax=Hymenobacter jejuensis TaxID=2502781 RepID=A0A5B7ZZ03_9BACT|nr:MULTISPECIES: hypothetical protein [Hymenobacter]MBC6988630.1 hypothetical protein [Hymenobacter sp. BT491]QDA59072.1 hypothetical protein FHG12_02650 [Hymenobacter jejuensis]